MRERNQSNKEPLKEALQTATNTSRVYQAEQKLYLYKIALFGSSAILEIWMRVANGFDVTRDGPKICWVTRYWTQIICVRPDRTSQGDDFTSAWRVIYKTYQVDFQDKWTLFGPEGYQSFKVNRVLTRINKPWQSWHRFLVFSVLCWPMLDPRMSLIFVVGPNNRNTEGTSYV